MARCALANDFLVNDLRSAAAANPGDADLQFLLGYHLYFTGQRQEARDCFQATLKIDANHAGARAFLNEYAKPHTLQPPAPAEPGKVNGDL